MHPVLFHFGPLTAYTYGFFMALAFGVSISLLARDAQRWLAPVAGREKETIREEVWNFFLFGVIPASLVGARLFYVLENHAEFEGRWREAFYLWQGGLVFYGGLLFGVGAAFFLLRRRGWPILLFLDITAPYILLGHVFGRLGCFANGCCAGLANEKYGVVFPALQDGLPRLPVQLYEAAGNFLVFLLLWFLRPRWLPRRGMVFSFYLFFYGTFRFVLEFLRRDPEGPRFFSVFLSPSQALSVGLASAGGVALVYLWFLRKREPPSAVKEPHDGAPPGA